VFDENIFPFQSLHPNAGTQLRAEILLLPTHLAPTSSNNEGIHVNDHMHIVPITDHLQCTNETVEVSTENSTDSAQNSGSNGAEMDETEHFSPGTSDEEDSPDSPVREHSPGSHSTSDPSTGSSLAHAPSPRHQPGSTTSGCMADSPEARSCASDDGEATRQSGAGAERASPDSSGPTRMQTRMQMRMQPHMIPTWISPLTKTATVPVLLLDLLWLVILWSILHQNRRKFVHAFNKEFKT
jgi:hypothetical protein